MRCTALTLASLVLLAACGDDDYSCGIFPWDPERMTCVCPEGTTELPDGSCMLTDGGVIRPPNDGGSDDAGALDAGRDAGPRDAYVPDAPELDCEPGTTSECPEGTSVGECDRGTRECTSEGLWGACTGAVGPAVELCDALDNDCDDIIDGPAAAADCGTSTRAASTTCSAGSCVITECETGWADCDGDFETGCEADLSSVSTCGTCAGLCAWACDTGSCNDAEQIAAGLEMSCAVRDSGEVVCWGSQEDGKLGNGAFSGNQLSPRTVLGPGSSSALTDAVEVATGWGHACALRSTGGVVCWGSDENGELGDGTADNFRTRPVAVVSTSGSGELAGASAIATGNAHTCAIIAGGEVVCWGTGTSGQLGNEMSTSRASPVRVRSVSGIGNLTGATRIAAGAGSTCAVLADSRVACWGTVNSTNRPTIVPGVGGTGELSGIASIGVGANFACGVRTGDGAVFCWGTWNDRGQLGRGSTSTVPSTPAQVIGVGGTGTLGSVSQVALGQSHACALTTDGSVVCWGNNSSGGLGAPSGSFTAGTPVRVVSTSGSGTLPAARAVTAGYRHSCAIGRDTGTVYCWGNGNHGELGNGTITAPTGSYTPVVALPPS